MIKRGFLRRERKMKRKILSVFLVLSILAALVPAVFAADNEDLILWYDFKDEASGPVTDRSGHGKDGRVFGGASYDAGTMYFNGTDGYVKMPDGLLADAGDFSIVIHVKPEIEKANQFTYAIGNASDKGYVFLNTSRPDGKLRYAITKDTYSGEQAVEAANGIGNNTWSDVVVTVSGDMATLYRDGVLTAQNTGMTLKASGLGNTTQNYLAKSLYSNDPYFKGNINDFRIYNKALSPSEITALHSTYQKEVSIYQMEQDVKGLFPADGIITEAVRLPTKGSVSGANIEWLSSDPMVLANNGTVYRPVQDTQVTLMAEFTLNNILYSKSFALTVKGRSSPVEIVQNAFDALSIPDMNALTHDLELKEQGLEGAKITWKSSHESVIESNGRVHRPAVGEADVKVTLTATVSLESSPEVMAKTKTFEVTVKAQEPEAGYLFAYFTGNDPENEKMYYALSEDGMNFKALNRGEPVLSSGSGTRCLRDPFILQGEDGYYYALATDMKSSLGWASNRNIITWRSADLIHWTDETVIEIAGQYASMMDADRVWAPQAIYDPERGEYMIYLAVRTQSNGATVMYRCYTKDFKSLTSEPELMFAPKSGNSAIDGDIIYSADEQLYYMYYKDETAGGIKIASAESLSGEFSETNPKTGAAYATLPRKNASGIDVAVEGSAVYKKIGEDKYNIIYDAYTSGFFVMAQTEDLVNFTQLSQTEYSFDFTPRHGYVIPVTASQIKALQDVYGEKTQEVKLLPDQASPFGPFDGWGTSLCWWANYIGYSKTLTKKAAKAFFNPEEGLGLNVVRYNIGGGDDPSHTHIYDDRPDGAMPGLASKNEAGEVVWDWNADYRQVNVLKAAVEEGASHVEAFANSAPYYMTISGCSSGGKDASVDNIAPENYQSFADYLTTVTKHFEDMGIHFDSLSPFNEPDTNYWGYGSKKQEGMHVSPGAAQSQLLLAVKDSMDKNGVTSALAGTEETDIKKARDNFNTLTTPAKDVLDRINTHTYGGNVRDSLKQAAASAQKGLWMSEVDGTFTAGTDAGNMAPALGLAQRINVDVNEMMPSAWVIWQIIDRHKKAGTVYADTSMMPEDKGYWGTAFADHDNEELILTKKYYAFGQYSRYVRPGDTIIANTNSADVLTAYNQENGKIVIVASNTDAYDRPFRFDLSAFANLPQSAKVIRTSSNENWTELSPVQVTMQGIRASLKANSITTFVLEPELDQYPLEIKNDLQYTVADQVEDAGNGLVKLFKDGKALKSDLTYGTYAPGDEWKLEPYGEQYYISNAANQRLCTAEDGSLKWDGRIQAVLDRTGTALLARYNQFGDLTGIQIQKDVSGLVSMDTGDTAGEVRLFFWDGEGTMQPLGEVTAQQVGVHNKWAVQIKYPVD